MAILEFNERLRSGSRKPLEATIIRWEMVASRRALDTNHDRLPLCRKYDVPGSACEGCPVFEETGRPRCAGTPHDEWLMHQHLVHSSYHVRGTQCEECQRIASDMLEFLKGLTQEKP